jgi:hypothetical protein
MRDNGLAELTEEFFGLEENLDLINKKMRGVYFWERVRFSVYNQLIKDVLEVGTKENEEDSEDYLSGVSLLLKNVLTRNPFLSSRTDLLFYGAGRRKERGDGLFWDIYHDPVIDSMNRDCLLWETPWYRNGSVSHATPAKTSNMRYVELIEYVGNALQILGISSVSLSETEASLINEVEDELRLKFDTEIDLESMVKKDLSKRRVRLPLYRRLIRKVDPNVAIMTVSYTSRETFTEACQLEDVPVVELQHGVINRYHTGYSFPYEEKNVFPDYFFSFGEFWSDSVDLPIPEDHVYSVGYPYLESESKRYEDVEEKDQILFISQPNIGEELSRFAVELSDCKEYKKDIVYKFHPGETSEYPWLKRNDITCITDEVPLYQLFAESTSQVGVNSTALYEGLQFDLSTYVLETTGHEYMQYLIENNYAALVQSTEELINKNETKRDIDKGYFFEDNPLQKFESAIEEVTD